MSVMIPPPILLFSAVLLLLSMTQWWISFDEGTYCSLVKMAKPTTAVMNDSFFTGYSPSCRHRYDPLNSPPLPIIPIAIFETHAKATSTNPSPNHWLSEICNFSNFPDADRPWRCENTPYWQPAVGTEFNSDFRRQLTSVLPMFISVRHFMSLVASIDQFINFTALQNAHCLGIAAGCL